MNYEKKYKLLREAVMLNVSSMAELKMKAKTDYSQAFWEGQEQAFIFLKGYIDQMLEDDPCEEVVEKMQDEIKADYYFERGE